MSIRKLVAVFLLNLALCITSTSVFATVVLPADFDTVVQGSQTIAHGRVIDVRSFTTAPGGHIESVVTLSVIDAIKGVTGPTLSFRVPYGQVGRYRRVMVGAPEFVAGDDVVVFLEGSAPQLPTVFGLSQGVYRVRRDADARAFVAQIPLDAFVHQVRLASERAR